jgi:hypothetical protein
MMMTTEEAFWISSLAAVGLICIAATLPFPTQTNKHKNWQHVAGLLDSTGRSALTLLPALSAFFLADKRSAGEYVGLGLGVWLLGLGFGQAANGCKRATYTDDNVPGVGGTCSKGKTFWLNLSDAGTTAGASLFVGALLAYCEEARR